RKRKIPERQKRGFFSSLESAYTKGALSTFRPPRRLLHSLRIQPRKELSSATLSAPLQAHPSIGKDSEQPGRLAVYTTNMATPAANIATVVIATTVHPKRELGWPCISLLSEAM